MTMPTDRPYDEERIGELMRLLPPAPDAWVKAAQELPPARRALEQILALAEADAEFRKDLLADLEGAIERAGHQPGPRLVRELRAALKRED